MNPKHIKEFDRIVKNIQQINKNSEVFELIRNYKEKYGYENYYNTLDSFGHLIGYQFTVDIISNSEYYPYFKINPNNVLNCDVGEIRLTINPFSNLNRIFIEYK